MDFICAKLDKELANIVTIWSFLKYLFAVKPLISYDVKSAVSGNILDQFLCNNLNSKFQEKQSCVMFIEWKFLMKTVSCMKKKH